MQKEKEKKTTPKECLEDLISRTFDEVKQRMCDDYCRYTSGKSDNEIDELWDSEICNACPLNEL
mgnify:CR=1 FL=1